MIGWGDAVEAKAVIYGKYLNSLTSPGFLRLKCVSRISMEGAWQRRHRLWCWWWDRKHFSPTSQSLPKSSTYPTRPTWTNPASKECSMAEGMPWGHSRKSHYLWTNRFLRVLPCPRLQYLLCSWHLPSFFFFSFLTENSQLKNIMCALTLLTILFEVHNDENAFQS